MAAAVQQYSEAYLNAADHTLDVSVRISREEMAAFQQSQAQQ